MSQSWKSSAAPGGAPPATGGPLAGGGRAPSALAEFNRARFTGYGGHDLHLVPPPPPVLGPIQARLRDDLAALVEQHRDFFARHADADPRMLSRTREGWAVTWRRWALDDLGQAATEARNVYVIHKGDAYAHRLFLDKNGRQLLAVQPNDPHSPLRYRKLSVTQDLCDLYGPFARLSEHPEG
ncbi:hypothetical protein [Pseudoroseomonas cervicalis]|uniref:hypothetical protein n=1 Tax=Teichococcus cervicalis TaxID=204525 RepID=UPI0022F195C6|nr:hypothetical protein [Pseudoroseomonas cervicalis]WBV42947.1 hypothetical protein PFY06_17205 [Pseudoroseomonas cervicalis]